MKLSTILIAAIFNSILIGSSLAQNTVITGSKKFINERLKIPVFSKLIVENSLEVHVVYDDGSFADIMCEDNIRPYISTFYNNDSLIIKLDKTAKIKKMDTIKIVLHTKSLKTINASLGCTINSSDNILSDTLIVIASKGSVINIPIKVKMLNIIADSGSMISLVGSTNEINAKVLQGSTLDANELKANQATANVEKASQALLLVSNKFSAIAKDYSTIMYKGNPKFTLKRAENMSEINSRN